MDASLRIRTATRGEAELLLEIQKASSVAGLGHVFPPDKYPFPDKAVLERWQKTVNDPAEVVVLTELDAAAVGFAAGRDRSTMIRLGPHRRAACAPALTRARTLSGMDYPPSFVVQT